MIRQYRATLLLAVLFACAGSALGAEYVGDGQLIDHGWHRLTNRYEVILGKLHIGRGGEQKSFHFSGLPHREFVLGLRLNEENCKLQHAETLVSFTVRNERGELVLHQERSLRDLVWETTVGSECAEPFGYVQGSTVASQGTDAKACERHTSTLDGARGTYFVARKKGSYQVSIDVRSAPGSAISDSLVLVVLQDDGVPPSDGNCS